MDKGALAGRLADAVRNPIFIALADGDVSRVASSRATRWYDALKMRERQLETLLKGR